MILIDATITTVGPLSISMPEAQTRSAKEFEKFPMMVRGITETGEKQETAYLPATTLRGYLRRAVVLKDMRQAAATGKPWKLQKTYAELIGQDAESEMQKEEIDLPAIKKTRESSPVLDLFGSGLGIKSRLRVSHFLPEHNIKPDLFSAVRKDLDSNEEVPELLAEQEKEKFYQRSDINSKRSRAADMVKDLKRKRNAAAKKGEATSELEKELAEAEKLLEKYKEEMGDMQVSAKNILSHYAIGADIDLKGKLIIEAPKDRDIDLLITGLNALSLFPILGAHSARGCGEVKGVFDFTRDGNRFKKVTVGGYKPAVVDDF